MWYIYAPMNHMCHNMPTYVMRDMSGTVTYNVHASIRDNVTGAANACGPMGTPSKVCGHIIVHTHTHTHAHTHTHTHTHAHTLYAHTHRMHLHIRTHTRVIFRACKYTRSLSRSHTGEFVSGLPCHQ